MISKNAILSMIQKHWEERQILNFGSSQKGINMTCDGHFINRFKYFDVSTAAHIWKFVTPFQLQFFGKFQTKQKKSNGILDTFRKAILEARFHGKTLISKFIFPGLIQASINKNCNFNCQFESLDEMTVTSYIYAQNNPSKPKHEPHGTLRLPPTESVCDLTCDLCLLILHCIGWYIMGLWLSLGPMHSVEPSSGS